MVLLVESCIAWMVGAIVSKAVATATPENPADPFQAPKGLKLESYDILSNVINNYAITVVSAQYKNEGIKEEELTFQYRIPFNAYISNLTIAFYNPPAFYVGIVKDRSSQEEVEEAPFRIRGSPGHGENFSISVPVQHNRQVHFHLIYEHPIEYRFGGYEYAVDLVPGQVTDNFHLVLKLKNSRRIVHAEVLDTQLIGPSFEEVEEQYLDLKDKLLKNPYFVYLEHSPSKWEQQQISSKGLNGELRMRYNLDNINDTRYLMVGDGHFCYSFSPEFNPSAPRHYVFLVDNSKPSLPAVDYIKDTIATLVRSLKPYEAFTVITYNDNIRVWNGNKYVEPSRICSTNRGLSDLFDSPDVTCFNSTILANNEAVRNFLQQPLTISSVWSNIPEAFEYAIDQVDLISKQMDRVPVIVHISQWTEGDTHYQQYLLSKIKEKSLYDVPIFTLGFGDPEPHTFLAKISEENNGFAANMFDITRSKASLQAFLHYTRPTSSTIQVIFRNNIVHGSLSQSLFHSSLAGSEHVVCGKTMDEGSEIVILLTTLARIGQFPDTRNWDKLQKEQRGIDEQYIYFLKRMWAHRKLKALIREIHRATTKAEMQQLRKRGEELSVQNNFGTEFAPMTLVEQDISKAVVSFPFILLQHFRSAKDVQRLTKRSIKHVPVQIRLSIEEQPDFCQLDKISGFCRAAHRRYFYNRTSKACEQFIYGGCDGNENRFRTKQLCERACLEKEGLTFFGCGTTYPKTDIPRAYAHGQTIVTKPGGYPWQVSLKTKGGSQCSGTIISDKWVLTSAPCVTSYVPEQMCIVAGEHTLLKDDRKQQLLAADLIELHEHPLSNRFPTRSDVALIRLNKRLKFTAAVRPAFLPPQEQHIFTGAAKVYIWNPFKRGEALGGFEELNLRIVQDEDCRRRYNVNNMLLPDGLICAELIDELPVKQCYIQAGSPMMCYRNHYPYVCGVASWSPTRECQKTDLPLLFTEVSYLISWIKETRHINEDSWIPVPDF